MTSGISPGDWRSQLPPESRQKIVDKIMETLKRHLPISAPEGLNELRKIAVWFEEKIYTAAISQEDYLRKISLKMLSMESKTQQPAPINPAVSISGNQNPAETGSSVLAPTLPAMPALTQSNISNVQNMPGMSQASANNPIAQGGQNDIYANAQRLLQSRQQLQQQSQNSSMYQNQLLLKQKMQQSSLLQPQATQSSLMQMSSNQSNNIQQAQAANMQSTQQQQNHIQQSVPSLLQQNSQSAANQQQGALLQQQAIPVSQQTMAQQRNMSNMSSMQQSHPHSQHNNIPEQQQQRMPIQQNNLLNIQQQQIISQQQLNLQSNMSGLQQHLFGSMPTISNLQPHRTMMMQKNVAQQQTNQSSMSMLQPQGQQAQHQSPQQLMSQFQNHPTQMQRQMLIQQHSNSMQREIQQRIQGPNNLLQGQTGIDQKPFIQTQRLQEVSSSTSIDSTTGPGGVPDWQEECYQKVKSMKELYYTDIHDFHEKITMKLQQQEIFGPPGKQSEQLEKLKNFRHMLERMLNLLQVTKSNIPVGLKDKLPMYETQIMSMIASHRNKKAHPQGQGQQEQFQHPLRNQLPSQVSHLQISDNSQVNTVNLHGSGASLQNMSMPSPTTHQSASNNTMQSAPNNNDPVQASSFNSMPQSGQQNSMNASQQNNMSTLTQNAMNNTLQSNVGSMQSNANVLHQHVKQEQQQLLQTQQLKQQLTQRHIQHQQQILHQQRQQQLLQHQQQQKQQQTSQPPAHQVQQQLQPMNEPNELKPRQVSGNKFEHFAGQRQHYYQQMKTGTSHPTSSPQNLQASSPQISYHSSPQIDQNGLVSSIPKANTTHIPSGNSPLAVTSTPFAPSPIQGEFEKPVNSVSQFGHVNHQQSTGPQTQLHSVAVNTPGISALPLLEECPPLGGNQSHVPKMSETGRAEQPMDRLIKVIRSLTPHALSSSVSDIGSVVSMVDRIAGSAPGNGSRTAVGEDLVAMTKCRLQARNFMSQDVGATSKKMKRDTSAIMPLNNVASAGSVNDSFKHFHGLESSELEFTATSPHIKRFKSQISHSLLDEIREINQKLIDTVVDICDEDSDSATSSEDGEGAVVKCSYTAVALSSPT